MRLMHPNLLFFWLFHFSLVCCLPRSLFFLGSSVSFLLLFTHSVMSDSAIPWTCSTSGFLVLHHLTELAQAHVHWVDDAIQPSHPLSSPSFLCLVFPSIRVISNELALCIKWPQYWSFSISPSNEYSGLISFKIDWLDLLAVQGTLKSLL